MPGDVSVRARGGGVERCTMAIREAKNCGESGKNGLKAEVTTYGLRSTAAYD